MDKLKARDHSSPAKITQKPKEQRKVVDSHDLQKRRAIKKIESQRAKLKQVNTRDRQRKIEEIEDLVSESGQETMREKSVLSDIRETEQPQQSEYP